MKRLTLIIPCYNEAQRLRFDVLKSFLMQQPSVSILFVDDGSLDNTASLIQTFVKENEACMLHRLSHNQGKAEAVRQGILVGLQQKPDYIGYWDADLSTPLHLVKDFLSLLDGCDQLDFVLGSRVKLLGKDINRKVARHYLGRVFATFASIVLRLPVYDTQCGSKVLRVTADTTQLFENRFISRWIFDVELIARYLRLRGHHHGIFELPLQSWEDVKGSKIRGKDFIRAAFDLLMIHFNYRTTPGPRPDALIQRI